MPGYSIINPWGFRVLSHVGVRKGQAKEIKKEAVLSHFVWE